ncbi:MAG: hypothetical protein ACE5KH_03610 [Candidatus Geothermarchaeales archaeon]
MIPPELLSYPHLLVFGTLMAFFLSFMYSVLSNREALLTDLGYLAFSVVAIFVGSLLLINPVGFIGSAIGFHPVFGIMIVVTAGFGLVLGGACIVLTGLLVHAHVSLWIGEMNMNRDRRAIRTVRRYMELEEEIDKLESLEEDLIEGPSRKKPAKASKSRAKKRQSKDGKVTFIGSQKKRKSRS